MSLAAIGGVIRNEEIVIRVAVPHLQECDISVYLEGSNSRTEFSRRWPSEFEVESEDGDTYQGQCRISIPDKMLFREVKIFSEGEEASYGEDWHLRGLYPFNKDQFERNYFREVRRTKDTQTLIFSLKRILDNYYLDPAHRCVVAVIYGYRAADSCDISFIDDAISRLRAEQKNVPALSATASSRTDRDQLCLSMFMILWHLELERGNLENCLEVLRQATEYAMMLDAPRVNSAYNTCRMILLYGMILSWAGQPEKGKSIFESNFKYYSVCTKKISDHSVHFREFMEAGQAVLISLQQIDKIKKSKRSFGIPGILKMVNRVKSPAAEALMLKNLERLVSLVKEGAIPAGTS